MRTLGEIPFLNARYYPNKRAIVSALKEFTWKEVNERVNRLANALIRLDCRKGDRVAILAYNSSEFVESCFACAKTGLIFVPLNFRLSVKEIEYILQDSTPNTLIFGEEFPDVIGDLKSTFRMKYIGIGNPLEGVISYEELIESSSLSEPSEGSVLEDDPLEILYTSGSTGFPKGVMHTHQSRLEGVRNLIFAGDIKVAAP